MDLARPVYRPPSPPQHHRLPAYVYWRRRAIVLLAAFTLTFGGYLGVTLAFALHNPSYGVSLQARAAEWGRQHGLGGVVTWVETEWYRLHPAKTGGAPPPKSFGSGPTAVHISQGLEHLAPPTTIATPAAHPLPGEGVWHVVGRRTPKGVPTVYEAFVRPDPVHTSYVVGVAWMDPTLLRAQLYSGSTIPGQGAPFRFTAPVSAVASRSLVVAFNAGFRMQDANGGYLTQGKLILPLRAGAASVVIFKDGTMTVGKWGRDFTMNNQIASVRQNLDLIVDNGHAAAGLAAQNTNKWGKTLGGTFNVWRSGLGVTQSGALIYVGGPALSISDLANVLVRAGAVRAMELDINTDWVQYSTYTGPLNTAINGGNGTSLLSSMIGPPSRYFTTWWSRDFFTMSLRTASSSTTTTTTSPG
ncbi:MAG: phosphodiester glycosidase family protein [Acidimicrobiales bacterium]